MYLAQSGPERPHLSVQTHKDQHTTTVFLHGEADIATRPYLQAALTGLELDGTKSVQFHVADLMFCDVGSMRQLFLFARDMRRADRNVFICGARPIFRKLACLLGATYDLGLV